MANIVIPNINGRQWSLNATFLVNFNNLVDPVSVPLCKLPPKAVIISGFIDVLTAWDSTTATITLGDTNNSARYLASTSLKTTGRTLLLTPDYVDYNGDDMIVIPTVTGTATVGQFLFHVSYSVLDRATEVQPN